MTATTKNQISGYGYDAAGNMITNPGAGTYTYDAENRMTATAGVTYTYDGDGKRVKKSSGKLYWYGINGSTLLESDLSGNAADEYVFFNGKRVARRKISSGEINYYLADHLGTSRVVSNATGTILDDSDFYPFGGERSVVTNSANNYKFTGKERDSESGLDHFGARYYASNLGRFLSRDPIPLSSLLGAPQTLNKYAYCFNNPLSLVDPDGRWPLWFHQEVVTDVFESYGPRAVEAINRGSDWVDDFKNGNQSADRSLMHSMRDGFRGQTPEQAAPLSLAYINAEVSAAVEIQIRYEAEGGRGYSGDAMERLGHAVHTATDATSPTHVGYQPWFGLYHPEGIAHVQQEGRIARSNESAAAEARHAARLAADRIKKQFEEELAKRRKQEEEKRKKQEEEKKKDKEET